MAANQSDEQVVSLKLLVNKVTNKVLFAEAGKDFVDVLCSFLTLPLGTIARLLQKSSNTELQMPTVGCLNSLYQSVADLNKRYFLTKTSKEMLLEPKNSSEDYCNSLKLNIDDTPAAKYCLCSKMDASCCFESLYTTSNKKCLRGNPLTNGVFMNQFRNGFVRRRATFVITDDLSYIAFLLFVLEESLLNITCSI